MGQVCARNGSDSEQADALVAMHGLVDSLYLKELTKKIKRGLDGQLTRNFATGAKTFGYRTIPVFDPSGKKGPDGRPALLGKRIEIDVDEAKTIGRIFEMAAIGKGIAGIAGQLNREGRQGTRGEKWSYGAIRRILDNERYLGKQIWGQQFWERKPGTRKKVARTRPRDEWKIVERPDLRIISDELWERVHAKR